MSRLTDKEVQSLQAIVSSEYQSGSDVASVVNHSVWTIYANPFKSKTTQSGVYASLIEKGMITVDSFDNGSAQPGIPRIMKTVAITMKGWKALQAAKKAATPEAQMTKLDKRIIRNARWLARFSKKHGGDHAEVLKLFTKMYQQAAGITTDAPVRARAVSTKGKQS